jgi:hypothetical protein
MWAPIGPLWIPISPLRTTIGPMWIPNGSMWNPIDPLRTKTKPGRLAQRSLRAASELAQGGVSGQPQSQRRGAAEEPQCSLRATPEEPQGNLRASSGEPRRSLSAASEQPHRSLRGASGPVMGLMWWLWSVSGTSGPLRPAHQALRNLLYSFPSTQKSVVQFFDTQSPVGNVVQQIVNSRDLLYNIFDRSRTSGFVVQHFRSNLSNRLWFVGQFSDLLDSFPHFVGQFWICCTTLNLLDRFVGQSQICWTVLLDSFEFVQQVLLFVGQCLLDSFAICPTVFVACWTVLGCCTTIFVVHHFLSTVFC